MTFPQNPFIRAYDNFPPSDRRFERVGSAREGAGVSGTFPRPSSELTRGAERGRIRLAFDSPEPIIAAHGCSGRAKPRSGGERRTDSGTTRVQALLAEAAVGSPPPARSRSAFQFYLDRRQLQCHRRWGDFKITIAMPFQDVRSKPAGSWFSSATAPIVLGSSWK